MARVGEPVEVEWQFDALDLRPVERWLASLPTLSIEADEQWTITALAGTGSTLTGVGYDATPAGEEPTIWQSPVRN